MTKVMQVHAWQPAPLKYVEGRLRCFMFLQFLPSHQEPLTLEAFSGGALPQGEAALPGACCVPGGDAARGSRLGA